MATYPKAYTRPAAVIFSTTNDMTSTGYNSGTDLILTDHGRQPLTISPERIETAGRMVNATYRSHFVAEKAEISIQWSDVPSRKNDGGTKIYTSDGYAGGIEILNYVESKATTFYVKLVIDNLTSSSVPLTWPEVIFRVAVKNISYTTKQRSGKFDMMDLEIVLTEV